MDATPEQHAVSHDSTRVRAPGLSRINASGDTGVARAALDWAIANGIEHGGWCPAGRRAEDGIIPLSYALQEVSRNRSGPDIRSNLLGIDALLLLNLGVLDGWTHRAVDMCRRAKKPLCTVQLEDVGDTVIDGVRSWLLSHRIAVLYVAGPRESKRPGIGTVTLRFLDRLFESV
jgi:Circularly permutated YpsA SLOG family